MQSRSQLAPRGRRVSSRPKVGDYHPRSRLCAGNPVLHRALALLRRAKERRAALGGGVRRWAARHVPLAMRRTCCADLRDEGRGRPGQAQRQGQPEAQPAIERAYHAYDLTSGAPSSA